MAGIATPPDACPADKTNAVALWDQEPRNLLLGHKVAWGIMAEMATQGYNTLADLADVFTDMTEVRDKGPAEFHFATGTNGFNAVTAKLHSIRLGHAIQDAKQVRKHRVEQLHSPQATSTDLVTAGQRESLEKAYAKRNNSSLPPVSTKDRITI